jgi:hypothetical protein
MKLAAAEQVKKGCNEGHVTKDKDDFDAALSAHLRAVPLDATITLSFVNVILQKTLLYYRLTRYILVYSY